MSPEHPKDDELANLLFSLGRRLHHEIKVKAADKLNPTQLHALFYLHCQGTPYMRDIADYLAIRPASLTTLINELERLGFIRREPNEHDKRQVRIRLTARGEKFIRDRMELVSERIRRLTSNLNGQERKFLIATINKLINNITD